MSALSDKVAADKAAVAAGQAQACGAPSPDPSLSACVRAQHTDDLVHVGELADGTLIQWGAS